MLPVTELTYHAGDPSGQVLNVMGMASPDGEIENDEDLTLSLSTGDFLTDVVLPRSAVVTILSPDSECHSSSCELQVPSQRKSVRPLTSKLLDEIISC